MNKVVNKAVIGLGVIIIISCLSALIISGRRNVITLAEKSVAAQKETVQEMHQRVMERLLSAPTGSDVYEGMIYIRNGNVVDQKPFQYQTANDADSIIKSIINGQDVLGKKCSVEPIYSVGNDGVLSMAISCRPKK